MQKKAADLVPMQTQKPLKQTKSGSYLPICSLTSYIPSWKILARVVQKGTKRTWTTSRGNGALFNIVLKDKSGDEIRGNFFNDEVDKFYDIINVDKVYAISGGRIKSAHKQYNEINHDFEINFDKTTTFEECDDDQDSISEISCNFTPQMELKNIKVNKKDDSEQPKQQMKNDFVEQSKQQIMRNKGEEDKIVDNKEEENQKRHISILPHIHPKNTFSFEFAKTSESSQKEKNNEVNKSKKERKSER